jgi:phosphatidylserine decarboxylase
MWMNLLYILPKNLLSRLVGRLMHIEWPKSLAHFLVTGFARAYQIRIDEAELPIESYPSIGKFFIRRLKAGIRPQAPGGLLTSPADSKISQIGLLASGQLIQAKGKTYDVVSFLKDPQALEIYKNGFFATFYLCPTDYHRVHSPVDGEIRFVTHIPGRLWPVNEWSVGRIDQLFSVNERVVIGIDTSFGPISVVLVGATNVGKISLSFEPEIISNQSGINELRKIEYKTPKPVKKGDELGTFHMGSTVVLVAAQGWVDQLSAEDWRDRQSRFLGQAIKMGEALL